MQVDWKDAYRQEVQTLALTGYNVQHSRHRVLAVKDADKARAFLDQVLRQKILTFGEPEKGNHVKSAVNIGFTFRGLEALGLPDSHRNELRKKARAFSEGAHARAARRLGDTGPSAVERWDDPMFAFGRAHVLIVIHGDSKKEIEAEEKKLQSAGVKQAFDGWDKCCLHAEQLTKTKDFRTVHFGYRDAIARPVIAKSGQARGLRVHNAGELLLGYLNDANFDAWRDVPEEVAQFFRNGSFAAVRKIEQNEKSFREFLSRNAVTFEGQNYLKAKLCGRWPNGAVVKPGERTEPPAPAEKSLDDFTFGKDDADGTGCPFGAHIRRTNPREDQVAPSRLRPLFRRGMPYGDAYADDSDNKERGIIGLFFCASIEDQFEHVVSEWIEKKPMGTPHRGNLRDPLVGQHDGAEVFHIPVQGDPYKIEINGFAAFVRTRGTLYAFFPSLFALREIAALPQDPHAKHQAKHSFFAKPSSSDDRENKAPTTIEKDSAPKDRFCDVVMEGGVTSGIIYSWAVVELAKEYRFKNIGGSSIGAFAAALTAAAEYRRRNDSIEGFQWLAKLPGELAKKDSENKTTLLQLFRPQDKTRRLFKIFLATLGHGGTTKRIFCALAAALWQYRLLTLLASIVTAVLALGPFVLIWLGWFVPPLSSLALQLVGIGSWAIALLLALAFAVVAAVLLGIVVDFGRGVVRNGFGLCRGWSKDAQLGSPDLAGYLHASIQIAAGRDPIEGRPLTFGDLWTAEGNATEVLNYNGSDYAKRSINLEVYATNLTHGRPYRFPLEAADDMGSLFFRPAELEEYFPKPILEHLKTHGQLYRPRNGSAEIHPAENDYYELPKKEDLPIAFAARLSMSFPLLISAVPLWAINYEAKRGSKERKLEKCWLSDGGLCSNFPIHLFDSFVPKWPTFGISLHKRSKHRDEDVWLPDKHYEGRGDTWDRGMACDLPPLRRLTGFLMSLWMATWHWNDMTMMRMPGVRDRVVRVLLKKGEGGVNIKMSSKEILDLAKNYGKPAGQAFVAKFVNQSFGWSEHRWVRFNRLLISLREQIDCFAFATRLDRYTLPLREAIDLSDTNAPLRGHSKQTLEKAALSREKLEAAPSEEKLCDRRVDELKQLLDALSRLESMFNDAGNYTPYKAVPRPAMRVRHPT
jgi:deferrochelatase/peroxidase EfeB/predicted acylesterase/phospholipase RssA